ncbi:MAG: sulfate permease [Rikenellaceae bacterium]
MKLNLDFQPALFSMLKGYSKETFIRDLISGIVVVVVALPLTIALAIASGVSPEQGLLSAIIGGFLISFLGGSTAQIGGPTGAFIVIVFGIIQKFGFEGLVVATLMSGIILVLLGVFKMGRVITYIPYPIIVGFSSGIALIIFSIQIPDLLGLTINEIPMNFIGKWTTYFQSISSVNWITLLVSLATIAIIVVTPKINKRLPGLVVAFILMTVLAFVLRTYCGVSSDAVECIGDRFAIKSEIPAPHFVPVTLDMMRELLPSAFTLALLGAIQALLSATVVDGLTGERHNSNTELMAQGVANIVVPLFGGIPVTGAIARTLTNASSGGKTPFVGIIHSLVLLLILLFMGQLIQYIPVAALAGVLVVVSYNMSDWRTFRSLLKSSSSDIIVLVTTFLLTVIFDLTMAIFVGLLMAMFLFMKRVAEVTKVSVATGALDLSHDGEIEHAEEVLNIADGVEVYEIDGPFFFGAANKFNAVMGNVGSGKTKARVIRMRKVPFMDTTGVHNLEMLVKSSQNEGIKIVLSGVTPNVRSILERSGFNKLVGEESICNDIHEALGVANKFVVNS